MLCLRDRDRGRSFASLELAPRLPKIVRQIDRGAKVSGKEEHYCKYVGS